MTARVRTAGRSRRMLIGDPNCIREFRDAPRHTVRFTAGRAICDEGLVNRRLIGRYWSCDGRIKPEWGLAGWLTGLRAADSYAVSNGAEA